jgi:pantetheine-phosphate adenylyltransferase
MSSQIAVFPGSFDPITIGHVSTIERSIGLFGKIIIAIGQNSQKEYLFSLEQRLTWLKEIFAGNNRIEIESYEGLTIDFCRQKNAGFILRGLRNSTDFEYERTIASLNKSINAEIETICIISLPEYSHISSTIVKELIRYKGKFAHLVPTCVSRDTWQA